MFYYEWRSAKLYLFSILITMKRFIKNCILLAIPFILYLFLIVIIDPFNYINSFRIIDSKNKEEISAGIEPHMYKIIEFQNNPKRNIVLGDSRTNGLFSCIESEEWSNLAYGGGSLKEMIQTFWWVTNEIKLDTVIMGINLNLYNKYNKRFWVEETLERNKSFFSYAFSKYVFHSTFLIIKSYFSKNVISIGKPQQSKDEFWKFQINQTATKFYEHFDYPDNYFKSLKEISIFCIQNNIKLIFWIPPTHIDFQKRKIDFGIEKFDEKFVTDLQSLGDLYDFDYYSELTQNKSYFRDPMHFNHEVGEIIYREIFFNSPHYSRYSKNKTYNQY